MKARNTFLISTMLAGSAAVLAPVAMASSHREAPAIAGMPRVDATDFYMFRSYEPGRQDYVTLIANYIPVQAPYGGPNYFTMDTDAIYEIHIDNDGAVDADGAMEDITFQFKFENALSNDGKGIELDINGTMVGIPLRQAGQVGVAPNDANINNNETYRVTMITGDRRTGTRTELGRASNPAVKSFSKPVDNIGLKTIPDYEAYARQHQANFEIPGCANNGRVFVGQRAEAFAVNLGEIFDLVNLVPIQGASNPDWPAYNVAGPFPGGITQDRANDDLVGKANVTSIALELPIACITGDGNGVIGGWTTASLPQARLLDPSPTYDAAASQGGAYVQVSRLSNPLVNEVVIGLKDKNLFNAVEPTADGAVATYVTNPTLPALLDLLFRGAVNATLGTSITNLAPTNFPRQDLVTAFLTGFPGVNQLATVTASEMIRLNTAIPATPRGQQNTFGVVAEDLAGFPNGRRPGDDTVDIALRVVMGALCHPLPLGAELGIAGAVEDTPSDMVNLGICAPEDAVVGNVAFTDGAPLRATELQNAFPYLNAPIPGSPNN
ncbi:DUF4331 domain-containing protein [Fertoebacter nigrum]|uniref:DUF4331 domain-containing protein n=1 Tax=Fertoeibacter niger TaxID=2656921 RepID=A0A8X8KN16_9RHOB|nr:DUF4331 domain-containing protein [Fertoeibacter niger]NUB43296.1 DUF4331 domain-containing protein [Fertoeibacter niger]